MLTSFAEFARGNYARGVSAIQALPTRLRESGAPRRHPVLFTVLVAVWLLYVFGAYLPALSPPRLADHYLRRTGAYDVVLVLWFAAVAHCAGKRILRRLGVRSTSGAEGAVFGLAVGVALYSWLMMALSMVHGLYRPVAYILLLIPTVFWHSEMRRTPGDLLRSLAARLRSVSWSAETASRVFLAAYLCAVLGVVLLSALGPSLEYDDLVYHLTGPKNFVLNHRFVPLPDVPLVFFPKNIEILYTLGLLLHSDVTAKLMDFMFGACSMLAAYGFARRFLSSTTGMVAAAILAASPLFIYEMRTAHNDLGLTFFLFAGTYATVVWLRTRELPWMRLACLCLAFSLGSKYWAIPAVGATAVLVFVVRLIQYRSVAPALSAALRLALVSSLGLLPWGLVNLCYTGNPLFPLLNGVFHSPYWTPAHTNMALGEMFQGGIRVTLSNWWEIFRLWWNLMANQHGAYGGNIGPFYVIFIPLFLLIPGVAPEVWFLLASSGLYYFGWAVSGPWVRFLLPALPGFAVVASVAVTNLIRLFASMHRRLAVAAGVFLAALAVLATPFFESYGSWSRYGSAIMGTLPLKYLADRESKDEYLARYYRGYPAVQFLNRIPGPKKVLYVHCLPDGFYLDGRAAFHYSPYVPGLVGQHADYVHRVLRVQGVTHLVVGQVNQQTSPLSSRESLFNHEYLRKLYHKNAIIVYELLPDRIIQEAVAYDFLDHLQEARLGLKQPDRHGRAYREVRSVGGDVRYTMVTVPPAQVEFPLTVPRGARLSFAVGKDNPSCTGKGSFQVWVTPEGGSRRVVYSLDVEDESHGGWQEGQADLSEWAGLRVAITFNTQEASYCCDYFWADPVLTAWSGASPEEEFSSEGVGSTPVVSGAAITPSTVRIGEDYIASFEGPDLTSETYFDLRFVPPGGAVNEVVHNWQRGSSSRHTAGPSILIGKWSITGVRAHRDPRDHEGGFKALSITLEVTR